MIDIIINMETADFDDILALCYVGGDHPNFNLRAVVLTPGSHDQVCLTNHILKMLNKPDVPVGVLKPDHPKLCVSEFHYKWITKSKIRDVSDDGFGFEIIAQANKLYPNCIILSGAPLGNIHQACINYPEIIFDQIVVQGGFAGDNVVAKENRLPKFDGKITCPTFNLNGNIEAALFIANESENFKKQYYVSKNVCHGVLYDNVLHEKLKQYKDKRIGLNLIYSGMSKYLETHPNGKLFHDPLAACTIMNKNVCGFVEGQPYKEKGEWGFRKQENTSKFISISVNRNEFENALFT